MNPLTPRTRHAPCKACGRVARQDPFVKPCSPLEGYICSCCGHVTVQGCV